MPSITRALVAALALLALASVPPAVPSATAGCGCDHPPPSWALVMPAFASPGREITIEGDGFEFVLDAEYEVDFGNGRLATTVADSTVMLRAVVPDQVEPGPVALRVRGDDLDHQYDASLFTALPPAPALPEGDGIWLLRQIDVAVSTDGTLMIPFDVSQISAPTQFAFVLTGMRLEFGQDDIVFFNQDGVDLTLFTLDVEDPTERTWGSYYGWNVQRDTGIRGDVFRERIRRALQRLQFSDMLTYWRHEFQTYKDAHMPGGSHEVDPSGFHRNLGTLHVDHDNLILMIAGKERDFFAPDDPTRSTPLEPGRHTVNLYVATKITENPIEPDQMDSLVHDAISAGQITEIGAD